MPVFKNKTFFPRLHKFLLVSGCCLGSFPGLLLQLFPNVVSWTLSCVSFLANKNSNFQGWAMTFSQDLRSEHRVRHDWTTTKEWATIQVRIRTADRQQNVHFFLWAWQGLWYSARRWSSLPGLGWENRQWWLLSSSPTCLSPGPGTTLARN